MPTPDHEQEKTRLEQELRIQRQVAFASGLFQGDVTIHTLLESLAEGVVIIDNSGTMLLVNTRAEKMFGYHRKELIGKPHAMLIPESLRKVHGEHEAHFFAEPRIRPMGQLLNLAGRRRDGSEFPLEISLSFIETVNGALVLAFVSDITLRKEYELHLHESQELFQILVEGVKDYAIFMLDPQGNILSWNAGAERLKGYQAEEITGSNFSCFYSEEERNEGKPAAELEKAAAEGRFECEGWRVRKDGSRFWANVIITALHDENGSLRGFSKVTRDITDRKRAEDALRVSEARYRTLFLDNPTMIITLDADWTILSANPFAASQLGYMIHELEGLPMLEVFHEDDRPLVAEHLRGCLQNPNRVYRWQFRKMRKDGSLLWVEEIAQAVEALNGTLNILLVCQDISERKRAEEEIERLNTDLEARAAELEAANRELEAFNYSVSHDLRVPLSVIKGYTQIIQELCKDIMGEKCKSYLPEILKSVSRMTELIDALLNFSRATRSELRHETFNLSALAKEIVAELVQVAPERRVMMKIAEGIEVNGDASLLRVALANLLGNAWKYTSQQEEAVIEFGVTKVEEETAYFVRDNGPGFDMVDAEKMFVPFQRFAGKAEFAGHGIGLATVERIIKRHGGRVWAEGALGKGAIFYFTLANG